MADQLGKSETKIRILIDHRELRRLLDQCLQLDGGHTTLSWRTGDPAGMTLAVSVEIVNPEQSKFSDTQYYRDLADETVKLHFVSLM